MSSTHSQSPTIAIGCINTLKVARDSDFGLYLAAGDSQEVLLPNPYVDEEKMPLGGMVNVFVYTDSEDRPVATTHKPFAKLGEYGYFKVVDYKSYGAFVDWGLPKDLFVPLSQQKEHFTIGKYYILRICQDEQTGRLYGTQKIGKYFERDLSGVVKHQEMNLLVIAKTPLGYKVLADGKYEGMLFDNEIFEPIAKGETKKGFVKTIRKDGKLDLTLRPSGKKAKVDEGQKSILARLEAHGGTMAFGYKSEPEAIKEEFGLSRKSFKKSLTELISADTIVLHDNTITLRS
jgi:uncharacterized protein